MYGAFSLAKREYYFIFENQVVHGVLMFHLCPKSISDWIKKICPIYCKIDSQVHALIELSLWVNTLWLEGGRQSKAVGLGGAAKPWWLGLRASHVLKSDLPIKKVEGLISRLVPCMQLSHQPSQGWKALGVGRIGH